MTDGQINALFAAAALVSLLAMVVADWWDR